MDLSIKILDAIQKNAKEKRQVVPKHKILKDLEGIEELQKLVIESNRIFNRRELKIFKNIAEAGRTSYNTITNIRRENHLSEKQLEKLRELKAAKTIDEIKDMPVNKFEDAILLPHYIHRKISDIYGTITISEIEKIKHKDLLSIPGFGKKTLELLEDILNELNA